MARPKKAKQKPLTPDERESLGQWARRVSQSVREFEKASGKPVNDDDLRPWATLTEQDRENYRKGGEAVAGGVLRSEQFFLDQLAQVRTAMGEKAFRQKLFSICIEIAVERISPHLSELERHKAV